MKRFLEILLTIILVLLFAIAEGKARVKEQIRIRKGKIKVLNETADTMKNEILRRIPLGSSLENAKKIMEENDFSCEFRNHEYFTEQRLNRDEIKLHENLYYLYCYIHCLTIRWQIAIVYKNNFVNEVLISTYNIFL